VLVGHQRLPAVWSDPRRPNMRRHNGRLWQVMFLKVDEHRAANASTLPQFCARGAVYHLPSHTYPDRNSGLTEIYLRF
jgi:hypothetical protein